MKKLLNYYMKLKIQDISEGKYYILNQSDDPFDVVKILTIGRDNNGQPIRVSYEYHLKRPGSTRLASMSFVPVQAFIKCYRLHETLNLLYTGD